MKDLHVRASMFLFVYISMIYYLGFLYQFFLKKVKCPYLLSKNVPESIQSELKLRQNRLDLIPSDLSVSLLGDRLNCHGPVIPVLGLNRLFNGSDNCEFDPYRWFEGLQGKRSPESVSLKIFNHYLSILRLKNDGHERIRCVFVLIFSQASVSL